MNYTLQLHCNKTFNFDTKYCDNRYDKNTLFFNSGVKHIRKVFTMSTNTDQHTEKDTDFDLVDHNFYIKHTIYCEFCGHAVDPEEEDLKDHNKKCKAKWIVDRKSEIEYEAFHLL